MVVLILCGGVVRHFLWGELMKYGHLERIEMTLRNLAPVFIGSGESLTKKEYILVLKNSLYTFLIFQSLFSS